MPTQATEALPPWPDGFPKLFDGYLTSAEAVVSRRSADPGDSRRPRDLVVRLPQLETQDHRRPLIFAAIVQNSSSLVQVGPVLEQASRAPLKCWRLKGGGRVPVRG